QVRPAAARDASLNTNAASTPSQGTSVAWDKTNPNVMINQKPAPSPQPDPTNSPINFTAVFTEAINPATFTSSDVTISGTTTGTKTVTITDSGNATTFNVAVSGMTSDGTVIATIPAGGVNDPATNANNASTSTDNT